MKEIQRKEIMLQTLLLGWLPWPCSYVNWPLLPISPRQNITLTSEFPPFPDLASHELHNMRGIMLMVK